MRAGRGLGVRVPVDLKVMRTVIGVSVRRTMTMVGWFGDRGMKERVENGRLTSLAKPGGVNTT